MEIIPYVIHNNRAEKIEWTQIPHDSIKSDDTPHLHWHQTKLGKARLVSEINGFQEMGVTAAVREGPDDVYQIRVKVDRDEETETEMVFLCPDDYPVGSPSVAILDNSSSQYNPFRSQTVDELNISKQLRDVVAEYYADK